MTKINMRQEVTDLLYFAKAAHHLNQDKAESAARRVISYLAYAYRCHFDQNLKLDGVLDGADLAEEIITFIRQTATSFDGLREVQAREEHHEFRESGGRLTEDDSGSNYSPDKDSESDSESDSAAGDAKD